MGGDVEHARVVPEDVLGAVAVVHVPVEHEDPFPPFGQGGGGHGHVVQEAEAHGLVPGGVMARGPHRHEGHIALSGLQGVHGGEGGTGGEDGRVPRARRRPGVGVDGTTTVVAQRPQNGE